MPNDPPLNCPFSEHADRRAPAVRLTEDTVEFQMQIERCELLDDQ